MAKQRAEKVSTPHADSAISEPAREMASLLRDGTRLMFTLSDPAIKLLDTAVLVDGKDRSSIVEGLILEHLASYFSGKQTAPRE